MGASWSFPVLEITDVSLALSSLGLLGTKPQITKGRVMISHAERQRMRRRHRPGEINIHQKCNCWSRYSGVTAGDLSDQAGAWAS
jgi:hypothetical protein